MDAGWTLLLFLLGLYLVPTVVAIARGHHNTAAICILNVLLGWTVLGWVGALIWSATAIPDDEDEGTAPEEVEWDDLRWG